MTFVSNTSEIIPHSIENLRRHNVGFNKNRLINKYARKVLAITPEKRKVELRKDGFFL